MATHKLTVLKTEVTKPEGKNYKICEFGYKAEDGKVKGMRIFDVAHLKPVFAVASASKPGDILEATFKQNDKGFWEFASLSPSSAQSVSADKPQAGASRGNWETAEERAARQVMIVRQSSLSNAIAYAAAQNPKGTALDMDAIIENAKVFENYVLDKPKVTGEVE